MRLQEWEKRLDDYLVNVGPFVWGKSDCCMFIVGAVKAMTEIDHGGKYKYQTEIGANRILLKNGGVEQIATKHFGWSKSTLLCKRGDVVSFDSGNGMALGICLGAKIAAMQAIGLIYLPMSKAIKGWSI